MLKLGLTVLYLSMNELLVYKEKSSDRKKMNMSSNHLTEVTFLTEHNLHEEI